MTTIALSVLDLAVLEKRPDGSGLVRMPIGRVSTVDTSRTAGGGSGSIALDKDAWGQVVSNAKKYKRPVPVYFGHLPEELRDVVPAEGFVQAVEFDGDVCWATIDMNASAFDAVITRRGFRGASVELKLDPTTPTETFAGWVLVGLAITNNPALPIEYAVAAAASIAAVSAKETVRLTVAFAPQKEFRMSDTLTLEGLQADKIRLEAEVAERDKTIKAQRDAATDGEKVRTALSAEIGALRIELAKAQATAGASEARVSDLTKALDVSQAALVKANAEYEKHRDQNMATEITQIVRAAISRGVPPALFDGYKEDPVKWLKSRYVSVDALKQFAESIGGSLGVKLTAVKSGVAVADDDPPQATEAERKTLLALGIDPKYLAVKSESDLREMRQNAKEKS